MAVKTILADRDSRPARDTIRQELNVLVSTFYYFMLNGLIANTAATLPGCAIATTTTKVKTAVATVVKNSGVLNAVGISDNAWTLTGGDLAISSFRRYLLLVNAADAFTVLASSDAATAAACVWPFLPADGLAIVGIVTIATDATHTFTPGTTALNAAGITATFIDGIDDSIIPAAKVTT